MALTTAFHSGLLTLADGSTAFASDACYAILVYGYTFDAADSTYADVSATELSTAGDYDRVALSGKSVIVDTGKIIYDSDDISFGTPVTIGPADGIILAKGVAATPQPTDPLLFYAPLTDLQSTNAVFAINTPNAIYEITIA